jgi:hypothetical protein
MNNYKMMNKNTEYTIVENKTGHVVYTSIEKRAAYNQLTFLNMGGAFDGWTPKFFLNKCPEFNYLEV